MNDQKVYLLPVNEPKSTGAHVRVERPKPTTLIKKKRKFSSYIRKFRGIGCKVIYDKRPPDIWGNICAFPLILGSPSLYI